MISVYLLLDFACLYASEAFLVLMQRHVCFHEAIIELSRQLPDGFCMQKQTEVAEL